MTLIMGYCGLRIGEVRALREKDLKDRTITVRASVTKVDRMGYVEDTTKTHRTRWVVVPEFIWRRLSTVRDQDPDTLLFPSGRLGYLYLTDAQYRRAFDPAAKEIGMPGLSPARAAAYLRIPGDSGRRQRSGRAASTRPRDGSDDAGPRTATCFRTT